MELSEKEFKSITRNIGIDPESFHQTDFRVALEIAESLPVTHSYTWLGKLGEFFHSVEEKKGKAYSELIARSVLVAFLENKRWKPRVVVPGSVQDELAKERERIRTEVMDSPAGHYLPSADAFYKDFSVLRGKAMPVYTGIADVDNTLWRRPLVFGSLAQRFRFIRILFEKPVGLKYYFQHHTHTSLLSRFNSDGWNKTYDLIADLLELNPDHKGFCGASWFYDPQLKQVSPRLAYLAEDPLAAGAERFHLGEDNTGSALAKSKTRIQLHQEGKYVPKSYALLWHRKSMISSRKRNHQNLTSGRVN